jgi:Phage integrase, N-terminal SAM-like domain
MSVERRRLKNGSTAWRVRWREGGHNRVRQFSRKRDAEAWDSEVRRRKRLGSLGLLDAGRETLDDFAREWFKSYAIPNLAKNTQNAYADAYDRFILPRLGGFEVRQLTPAVIEEFQAELRPQKVGSAMIRKTLAVLQGILTRAVVRGLIASNPVAAIDKPKQRRSRSAQAVSPRPLKQSAHACSRRAVAVTQPSSPFLRTRASGRVKPWHSGGGHPKANHCR